MTHQQRLEGGTSALRLSIARQRTQLWHMLSQPMAELARRCAPVWDQREALDRLLMEALETLPHVKFLYAMDTLARQISSNASRDGLIKADFGRERSQRPYMKEQISDRGMILSEAYISLRAGRPSLTCVQRVSGRDGGLLGFLGADFDLRDLPLTRQIYQEPERWQQVKGDPAIRGFLFQQTRADSLVDRHLDEVLPVVEELICANGVFHTKIHFSSSRATIWLIDDPYRYRLLDFHALVDPDTCLAYPHRDYPREAAIPADQIRPILLNLRRLRLADDVIYLRSSSINIFNGIIALTFSCDGSHYLPYAELLDESSDFWKGIGRL